MSWFTQTIEVLVMALEAAAAIALTLAAIYSIYVLATKRDLRRARLTFTHGLLYAFDFTIAADVLKLAQVPNLQEAAVVGAVVVIRVALTFLLLWELGHEESSPAT